MDYKEKVALSEEYYSGLLEGLSRDEVEQGFITRNIPNYNLVKIRSSVNKKIRTEYEEKVTQYLLDDTLAEHLDEFDLVDEDAFEGIQKSAVKKLVNKTNAQVSKQLKAGTSDEEIMKSIDNPFYGEDDFERHKEKWEYYNAKNKNVGTYRIAAVGALLLGIVLTFNSMSSGGRDGTVTLYYGLIIVACIYLYRSFQTQSDIDFAKPDHLLDKKFGKNRFED